MENQALARHLRLVSNVSQLAAFSSLITRTWIESVAAYTHRPLFAVTCGSYQKFSVFYAPLLTLIGDIGQTAEQVESRLETNFQLAHRWGCVLLLDEAE